MDTKLTLSIDEVVIERAKAFAKKNHTSLSQIVENYLSDLTRKEKERTAEEISPLVRSLSGVLKDAPDFEYKKERENYLQHKYI